MKHFLRFLFICIVISIAVGYYVRTDDYTTGNKIIGFTVLFGIFIFMPLFLYHRWKGKNYKDYMLSEENFKKMREKGPKEP